MLLPSATHDWLLAAIFLAIAGAIEDLLVKGPAASAEDMLSLADSGTRAVDSDLRAATVKLGGRNTYKFSKVAKKLKVALGTHSSRADHTAQRRYWLASRKAMMDTNTHIFSNDATRFARRDWQCGCIANSRTGVYAWVQPMALRDSGVRGTRVGENVSKEEKSEWKLQARVFLQECLLQSVEEGKAKLPKKMDRLASFYLLHACEKILQGQGLPGYTHYYDSNTDSEVAIEKRPLLIENMDSGSQNMCKAFYLLNSKKARYLPIWDLFHKRSNMTLNAYKSVGLWASIKLQSITFEINRGPFKGYAFFVQQLEAMEGLLDTIDENDELFGYFFEGICKDRGLEAAVTDPLEVLTDLREAKWLQRLGPKTAPSRWFSWHAAQEYYEEHNTERLAGMCYLGVQQGWFSSAASPAQGMLKGLTPRCTSHNEGAKESMAEGVEKERRMRDRCANGLHLSATILSNPDIQFDIRMARMMSQAQSEWHSHKSHFLKSEDVGLDIAYELASGKDAFKVIMGTAARMGDLAAMNHCGVQVDFTGGRWRSMDSDHPEVMNENLMVKKMYELQWALISEEVKYFMMWHSTYPYRWAILAKGTPAEVESEMNVMRTTFEAWGEASTKTSPFWKAACKKSPMNWTLTRETFQLFASDEWQLSDRGKEQIGRMFHHNMSTLPVERAFQKVRDSERDNSNQVNLSAVSIWRKPTLHGVLDEIHDFKEVDPETVPAKSEPEQLLPSAFFLPNFKTSSDNFKDLPGRGTAPWATEKASELFWLGGVFDLMRWCYTHSLMDKASASWKSGLVQPGTVIGKKGEATNYFVLGSPGSMVYLWPAVSEKFGKATCWQLRSGGGVADIRIEPILEVDDWEVQPVEILSPAGLFFWSNKKPLGSLPTLPVVQTDSERVPLLTWIARRGFKGIKKQLLTKLDKEEVKALTGETEIGEMLMAMIKKVLGVSDEEAADLLEAHLYRQNLDERSAALDSEEARDILDTKEKKEADDILKAEDKEDHFAQEIAKTVRSVRNKAKPPPRKGPRLRKGHGPLLSIPSM